MHRKLIITFFVVGSAATALLTSGCQTIQGAGEDIENAGEALEDAVE